MLRSNVVSGTTKRDGMFRWPKKYLKTGDEQQTQN